MHAHAFPDRIAARATEVLMAGVLREEGREIPPRGEATLGGVLDRMRRDGVSLSLILPIATAPHQTDSILRFAREINAQYGARVRSYLETGKTETPLLLSFASLHPGDSDPIGTLEQIREAGFIGIKLHPEFQQFYIDSKESLRILRACEELSLYCVLHAGADIGMPPPVHCTPMRLANVLTELDGSRVIAAHMGGFRMWREVLTHLAGKKLYLDTAYIGVEDGEPSCELYTELIRTHGANKILFGSDYPWKSPSEVLALLASLGLPDEEMACITHKNARELLRRALL